MNANELAQEFEEYLKEIEELPWGNHQILCDQAATMLRILDGQLAFRIDAVTKYQAWVKELEISKQSWEIIAKGYSKTIDEQQAEIEALKKAIIEYADCVGSMEGTDFIGDLKYMGTSQESIALLYKLNGYDENGRWIHTKKASEK